MGPLLLPIPPLDPEGKIRLTLNELQDLIDKAYEAGLQDGGQFTPAPNPGPSPDNPLYPNWTFGVADINTTLTQSTLTNETRVNWSEEVKKAM